MSKKNKRIVEERIVELSTCFAIKYTIEDGIKEVTATFIIPEHANIEHITPITVNTCNFSLALPHLTTFGEQGEYCQILFQNVIFQRQHQI